MKVPSAFRFHLLALLIFFLFSGTLSAQDAYTEKGQASLDKSGKLVLEEGRLHYDNVLLISDLPESQRRRAATSFPDKNTQLVTFVVDEVQGEIHIQIELRSRPDWTVADWNAYLAKL